MTIHLWDTHCHLNDPAFAGREAEVIRRARDVGVGRIVVPAYDLASLERTWALAHRFPDTILPALGLHPWYMADDDDLAPIEEHASRPGCRAIGEIGLDVGSEAKAPLPTQERVFRRQLELAQKLQLPALVHCRRAFPHLLAILKEGWSVTLVLHSFGGAWEVARELLGLGAYLAFAGTLTRSNSRKARDVARRAPWDRLLLETDAPCIATERTPAGQVEPAHVAEVAAALASLRGVSIEEAARRTSANAQAVFGKG